MSYQAPPALFLALLLGLASCARPEPFVETPDLGKVTRTKAKFEQISVCYSDGDRMETLSKLAGEECAKDQKVAHYLGHQRWQCRLTVPHLASFVCLPPDQAVGDKRQYLPGQNTGLPAIATPDSGGDLFGTLGIMK
jgi:hypothetical protein